MSVRHKALLSISWNIGLIAFAGGWTIFLLWAGARYVGAWNFEFLVFIGFYWLIIFFFLACFGLLALIIYTLINARNLHRKILFAGILLLINIPSVMIILPIQHDIGNKVFIKLTNKTGAEISDASLQGNLKTWRIGNISNNASKVFNYDPPYWNYDARLYQKPDSLQLIFKHGGVTDTIDFPTLKMGECKHVTIDKNLRLSH
ncbi:MAG: hypothetical protein IPM36_19965 [Lewinellaceae bacterium]|nr:hypothetical protein [Lewinellaceae bacterium]